MARRHPLRGGRVCAAADLLVPMGTKKSDARSARAWALAGRQHGIVTRRDLIELGYTSEAIRHRIAKGRLHPVMRGVYAVGWPHLTRERRWMAAVLACGQGAALSHRSAAALWVIAEERPGRIDVSVRRRCEPKRAGVQARSRPPLPPSDFATHMGIPVTVPVRTLVDMATELTSRALERAVNQADKHDVVSPDELRAALVVNRFEVDFYWPNLGLVVETDGLRYHRTASSQAHDRLRDQTHTAAGLTHLRFAHSQVRYEPTHVRRVLRRTCRRIEDQNRRRSAASDF